MYKRAFAPNGMVGIKTKAQSPVNGSMLILARESRGLTQTELASRLGISQGGLSKLEMGIQDTSDEILARAAKELSYPVSFFHQNETVYGPGVSQLFHRKRNKVPVKQLRRIHARINVMRIHIKRLLNNVDMGDILIRPLDLDDFADSPEDIARAARAMWRMPSGPVNNLVDTIESAGGIIVSFDFGTAQIDGISEWPPDLPPLFFINSHFPADRQRWTLAHELGHMIMHSENPNADMEQQANRFAAEFLAPAQDVKPYLRGLTLQKLAQLKPYWKISMGALLHRAATTREITESQARAFWMQLSRRGWRTKEPPELAFPIEQPTLLKQLLNVHRAQLGFTISDLAETFCLSEAETHHLYFNAPTPLRSV